MTPQKNEKKNNCNGQMEIFSRVVGYYRPTLNWNKAKAHEFEMRKTFKLSKCEDDDKSKLTVD